MIIRDNTKKNIKSNKRKNEFDYFNDESNNKVKKVLIAILVLLALILGKNILNSRNNFNYLKDNKKEKLVYTVYSEYSNKLPHINIKSEDVEVANKEIENFFKDNVDENDDVKYNFQINGKYLSVVITTISQTGTNGPEIKFKSFIIDLKTRKTLDQDEIYKLFKLMDMDVENKIKEQLEKYYNDEIKEGYIVDSECDFDCFLNHRGINNYLDDISYGIENGKLVVYKPFNYVSIFDDEDYYKEESFKFVITD